MRITRRGLGGVALAAGLGASAARAAAGVLNVATIGEPPTLDPMLSTADLVGTITQHMHETLYTFGTSWAPTPLLAAALPEISGEGTVYTIPLRRGDIVTIAVGGGGGGGYGDPAARLLAHIEADRAEGLISARRAASWSRAPS